MAHLYFDDEDDFPGFTKTPPTETLREVEHPLPPSPKTSEDLDDRI
ncbi:hypothetical protein KORDIASMS9_00312 [Kordia sp. SMS9]|nr:hypothetical protein [Kordia sp. SMS9]AXG68122.1 hypothetical protein KORDIASMS9_00312 [Kordia sp. SMS9]